ncbi:MAG: ATP-binding protein [Gammaproteobacteria bacterium]
MKKQVDKVMDASLLRQSAEQVLVNQTAATPDSSLDDKRLLHELQVHQIELELLNENLRHTQAELEKSRAHYFDLYDRAPVGYLTVNAQDLIQEANQKACSLLGLTRNELFQQPLHRFILPADQDIYYLHRKQLLATTTPPITELRLMQKGDAECWVRLKANQATEVNDNTVFRVVMSDITKEKQAEQTLLEAKRLADEGTRLKSEFLANMSHEIRTPMNAIVGISELVLNLDVSPKVREYLKRIRIATRDLMAILNDILDFSKVESGCMRIESACFSLDDLLDNLRALYSLRAQEKQIALTFEVNADVPRNLIGDLRSIQQILTNLLSNALKFTDQGNVLLKVERKRLEATIANLEFSVTDTGIGISECDLTKLFQPFSQVDGSITRRFGGTGLGLAISHRLLRLMGSDFHVDSIPGKGSRFSFTLSLGFTDHNAIPAYQNTYSNGEGALTRKLINTADALARIRILVAEDNEINQILIKDILELSGLIVEVANNGRETLALLEKSQFDALLLDIHMPEISGIEVARRIRTQVRFSHLPIIAVSAGVTRQEREQCLANGINDFVSKPFLPETLIATLTKWLKKDE